MDISAEDAGEEQGCIQHLSAKGLQSLQDSSWRSFCALRHAPVMGDGGAPRPSQGSQES